MNPLHRKILKKKYPREYRKMKELINLDKFTNLIQKFIRKTKTEIRYREVIRMQQLFIQIRSQDPNSDCVKIKIVEMQLPYQCFSTSSSSNNPISKSDSYYDLSDEEDTGCFDLNLLTETEKNTFADALQEDIFNFLNTEEEKKKKYASFIVHTFHFITKHDLKTYRYLLKFKYIF